MRHLALLILSALLLRADIAVVTRASITDDTGNSTLTTAAVNSTGADTIVVAVEWGPTGTATVADVPNGAYTACTGGTATASGVLQMFYKQAATSSASHTVTATFDGSRTFRRMMVWFLSGGHASSLIDAGCLSNTGTNTSPATTSSLTQSGLGGMIIAAVSNNDGIDCTFTANNVFTLAFGSAGTLGGTATHDTNAIEKLNTTGAQTPSVGFSASGAIGDWRMVAVALKPASGGGGGGPTFVRRRPVIQ